MQESEIHKQQITGNGFTIIEKVFSKKEINSIIQIIEAADSSNPAFRKSEGLFAIRRFLLEVPRVFPLVFTEKIKSILHSLFGPGFFIVKSIYFDKPAGSNWFVAIHQDLTIAVDRRADLPGFGPWTVKQQQFAVQPPLNILQNNYTLRIHLDDTDENNGALKVIPKSHLNGILRPETLGKQDEIICSVAMGGIMLMKPLLLHTSSRSTGKSNRRVIHIEFSNITLPMPLQWAEKQSISEILI